MQLSEKKRIAASFFMDARSKKNQKVRQKGGFCKHMKLTKFTKKILDFMFYAGIAACLTLPLSMKFTGKYFPVYEYYYIPMVILFFIAGSFAVLIIRELRRMFGTVLKEDCFVEENVESLKKMGTYSFCIAAVVIIRVLIVIQPDNLGYAIVVSPASLVIILVFIIAGLFSKVLAGVFNQAVQYKLENDLTI